MSNFSTVGMTRTASIVVAVIIIVAGIAGAIYAISLGPSSTSSPSTSSSTTSESVVLGFSGTPDVTDTPGFLLWQVYAKQLGLSVQPQYFDGDPTVARAVVAGSVQVGEGGFVSVLDADESAGNSTGSYPFVLFAAYETTNDFALVVSNSITNWSQLAGQPIGVFSPGAGSDIFCHHLLAEHGIPSSEQNCVPAGDDPTRTQEMISGKLVGSIIEPFDIVTAVETGRFHIMASIPQEFPHLLFNGLYSSRSFMTAHPDIILKLTEAALLADRWAHNETAWIAEANKEFPGINDTLAGAAWKIWMAMNIWDPYGGLSLPNIIYSENFYVNISQVKYYLAPKFWVDLSYQTQAISLLGNYTGPLLGYPDPSIPTLNFTIPGVSASIIGGLQSGILSTTGIGFGTSSLLIPTSINSMERRLKF
jgi:ABC-type nitrate/sulfonate/bicarbonate transport system substrate-binding protein